VRGAIFNALHSLGAVQGANVLDGFCGTGALGLEALSRGAAACTFVDVSKVSLDLAKFNAENLGAVSESRFILKDLSKVQSGLVGAPFDLVFLDPPYHKGLVGKALEALEEVGLLINDTICIVEAERSYAPVLGGSFSVQAEKIYGDTKVYTIRYAPT
jgi:16S rRNA (guanine966-N2)-methyltransferase